MTRSVICGALSALLASTTSCTDTESAAANDVNSTAGSTSSVSPPQSAADRSTAKHSNDGATLSGYVGRHPSEEVHGKRFLDEPLVRAAVATLVPEGNARNFIFNYDGPDAPIVRKAGRILAWGCERHNCGYHNWSVSITPDGSNAEVCFYQDDDTADGQATWYLANGKKENRPGNCPSD